MFVTRAESAFFPPSQVGSHDFYMLIVPLLLLLLCGATYTDCMARCQA